MASVSVPTGDAEREKEVIVQMDILRSAIGTLQQVVDRLEPQLEVILRSKTTTDEDKMEAEEGLCPLASEIRSIRYKVEGMNEKISDILRRNEV